MAIEVRPAREADAPAIVALVRSERLNPNGLDWRRFHVADEGGTVVGTVQVRPHGPELGSLAVCPDHRGQGVAGRLVTTALAAQAGPVFVVCPAALALFYTRRGFARIAPRQAPLRVALNLMLGQALGSVHALLTGRRPRRLVALVRRAP